MNEKLAEISSLLQAGKAGKCKKAVKAAVEEGIPAQTILDEGLLSGMNIIGAKFKANEVFVPEVLVAARCMNKSLDILKPLLMQGGAEPVGTVVIGTVKGDLHDIGKNLVGIMMQGKGLTVIDLGVDVPAERFVEAAKENNADIVACSALLTTTMGEMQGVVDTIKKSDIADKVKIMIGGAPITPEFCVEIGADKYTADGAEAAEAAYEICVA
ncbi:corrinoid protein [Maledivibacter halophilus]|uniref:Methanogenic corrinoid protein MtbC1 n=1 Tax=Maledivibacter halophilus TaxID=36842 RepID=A0A1T5LMB7_9FIRM|nr:corrinoid protein [Maledivibacter halophilus]SKC77100.1 Methanogenic corrinoid protein MtbC1 [Maledivibacter halophilus]